MQYKQYYTSESSEATFKQRGEMVSEMAAAFTDASKGEYLKPTTIAGYIFSRLTNDYMQGVQTPINALVETHLMSSSEGLYGPQFIEPETNFLFSFERVGNYLRTIDSTLSKLPIHVSVILHEDGYYVNLG